MSFTRSPRPTYPPASRQVFTARGHSSPRPLSFSPPVMRRTFVDPTPPRSALRLEVQEGESTAKIIVTARIRPKLDHVDDKHDTVAVRRDPTKPMQVCVYGFDEKDSRNVLTTPFAFDAVFTEDDSQETVYAVVKGIIDSSVHPRDVAIMCYGQTGSGKTHTIVGKCKDVSSGVVPPESGVLVRLLHDLLQFKASNAAIMAVTLNLEAVEIYNDIFFDLLNQRKAITVRDTGGELLLLNCTMVEITSPQTFLKYYKIALGARVTKTTNVHDSSSRSHAIFRIHVVREQLEHHRPVVNEKSIERQSTSSLSFRRMESFGRGTSFSATMTTPPPPIHDFTKCCINLVDLAGSERLSKSGAVGLAQTEAKAINKSLSALGNVVHALHHGHDHIPYRDSKLTKLLRHIFISNQSRIVLIVNVTPTLSCCRESICTLQFADRVKGIVTEEIVVSDFRTEVALDSGKRECDQLCADLRIARTLLGMPPQKVHLLRNVLSKKSKLLDVGARVKSLVIADIMQLSKESLLRSCDERPSSVNKPQPLVDQILGIVVHHRAITVVSAENDELEQDMDELMAAISGKEAGPSKRILDMQDRIAEIQAQIRGIDAERVLLEVDMIHDTHNAQDWALALALRWSRGRPVRPQSVVKVFERITSCETVLDSKFRSVMCDNVTIAAIRNHRALHVFQESPALIRFVGQTIAAHPSDPDVVRAACRASTYLQSTCASETDLLTALSSLPACWLDIIPTLLLDCAPLSKSIVSLVANRLESERRSPVLQVAILLVIRRASIVDLAMLDSQVITAVARALRCDIMFLVATRGDVVWLAVDILARCAATLTDASLPAVLDTLCNTVTLMRVTGNPDLVVVTMQLWLRLSKASPAAAARLECEGCDFCVMRVLQNFAKHLNACSAAADLIGVIAQNTTRAAQLYMYGMSGLMEQIGQRLPSLEGTLRVLCEVLVAAVKNR